ncbi:hypothetical protein, partial [Oceanisphaera marina]|uniref:hypothetical protein n=1 Tax=Oceanisphaera marina TaxID=2017550 RepID=UPI001E54A7DA
DEISWMQENVKNLGIQGKELHSTFFIKNKNLYKHIKIHKIEASYTFDFEKHSGSCNISFEFTEFMTKEALDAELLISVNGIRFKNNESGITQSKIKETLLSQVEDSKLELYNKYSN